MQRTAQDWLVQTGLSRHSARAVGIVMALQFAPQILLLTLSDTPLVGWVADRLAARRTTRHTPKRRAKHARQPAPHRPRPAAPPQAPAAGGSPARRARRRSERSRSRSM
ncbi:hypothetical protein DRA46_05294 [Burkholderia gladioli]|nr:hypothetical protein [Burkholderia gladioli]